VERLVHPFPPSLARPPLANHHGRMLGRFSLLSGVLWVVFLGGVRVAVIPPESCGDTNVAAIERAAREAADWIARNQSADGSYLYVYHPAADEIPDDYNTTRHAGVTMALYQAAVRYADPDLLATADRSLDWMRARLIYRHDWAALAPDRADPRLGATALMTAGLAERRSATGETLHDDLMRQLGRFMLALQRDDGGFYVSYSLRSDAPVIGPTSRYYPGEATWALALLDKAFPGEGWGDAARRGLDFLTLQRDDLEGTDFPPLPDQWAAYALAEMSGSGLSDEHIEYARRLARRFAFLTRFEAQQQGGGIGGLVRGPNTRAAGAGTWAEGLTALWRLSATDARLADLSSPLRESTRCMAGILTARQVTEEEAARYARPDRVRGAWVEDDSTRMDGQQHAFSGLIYTTDAIEGRSDRTSPQTPAGTR
jgi:hypothetical protein